MKKELVYIDNDSLNPYFNFGLEYYLTTEKCFDDKIVFIFWRTSPTLMVGKYQNTYEEINLDYAHKEKINIVRRLSGGGTIYTDLGGWQYSFITKDTDNGISFKEYISPVIDALKSIGIEAEFNGRNDLVIENKKISGTAQYKHNGYTVHHGSLLYSTDIEKMVRSTTVDKYKIVSKGIKSVKERVTNIVDHMVKPIGIEEFKGLIVNNIIGDKCIEYNLNKHDLNRIEHYARLKFDNTDSIFGKNPPCNIRCKGHFNGGNMEIKLDVLNGVISSAHIYGDFFANCEKANIEHFFEGCEYTREAVYKRLRDKKFEDAVYMISADDIVGCMFNS